MTERNWSEWWRKLIFALLRSLIRKILAFELNDVSRSRIACKGAALPRVNLVQLARKKAQAALSAVCGTGCFLIHARPMKVSQTKEKAS